MFTKISRRASRDNLVLPKSPIEIPYYPNHLRKSRFYRKRQPKSRFIHPFLNLIRDPDLVFTYPFSKKIAARFARQTRFYLPVFLFLRGGQTRFYLPVL